LRPINTAFFCMPFLPMIASKSPARSTGVSLPHGPEQVHRSRTNNASKIKTRNTARNGFIRLDFQKDRRMGSKNAGFFVVFQDRLDGMKKNRPEIIG